jgi:metal-responsive CopG/Arc/MetJ family transcriptional regulator
VLTEFRLTGEDMAVLDSLVDEAEATGRSQLIKVALRHHLTG